MRILNSAFDAWGRADLDFYPKPLRAEIDAVNALVYANVNNGVYRAGFATTQAAYEDAYNRLFATLDELEARLSRQRYLVGNIRPRRTGGCSPPWCASMRFTTAISNAIGVAWRITPTCGVTPAIFSSFPAWRVR